MLGQLLQFLPYQDVVYKVHLWSQLKGQSQHWRQQHLGQWWHEVHFWGGSGGSGGNLYPVPLPSHLKAQWKPAKEREHCSSQIMRSPKYKAITVATSQSRPVSCFFSGSSFKWYLGHMSYCTDLDTPLLDGDLRVVFYLAIPCLILFPLFVKRD